MHKNAVYLKFEKLKAATTIGMTAFRLAKADNFDTMKLLNNNSKHRFSNRKRRCKSKARI